MFRSVRLRWTLWNQLKFHDVHGELVRFMDMSWNTLDSTKHHALASRKFGGSSSKSLKSLNYRPSYWTPEANMNVWAKCHDGLSNTSEDISLKTTNVNRLVALNKRLRGASLSAGYTVREHECLGHVVCDVEIFQWTRKKLWPAGGAKEESGYHQTH